MKRRSLLALGLATVAGNLGCGGDSLDSLAAKKKTSPTTLCPDGGAAQDGVCPESPAPGRITGQICDQSRGIWLAGITASVAIDTKDLTDTTDNEGRFVLEGIPAGDYYVYFTGPDRYEDVLAASVQVGQTTTIGAAQCTPPPGHLRGRVCDGSLGFWLEDAQVLLDDTSATTTHTNQLGQFMFYSVLPGDYSLSISHENGFTATRVATVLSGEITDIGPDLCYGATGSIAGRVCGADGYWLVGASVKADLGGGAVAETTTDGTGSFTLNGIPAGTHTVVISKGSFSTTIEVAVVANQPTVIPDPVCIPPTTTMAVVTGEYDSVETVLGNLGYTIRHRYETTTPTMVSTDGTVDVILGKESSFWIDEFLADPLWMSDYAIIFLNCGLSDTAIAEGATSLSPAITNLRAFVDAGGSVYASDWASEMIRLTFPGRIDFYGSESAFGAARAGVANPSQGAEVVDSNLAQAVGKTAISINLNLYQWVVVEQHSGQPPNLRVLVRGDIDHFVFGPFSRELHDSPLVMRFDYGGGRVLFTSAHHEGQTSPDLQHVLNYIIFEL